MTTATTNNTQDILTKVRNRAADIHSKTGKSPLKLEFGKQEWDEFCEFAAKNWMVFPKVWQANYLAGIRIIANPVLPHGIYTEEEAQQAEQYLSAKEGE